MSTTSTGSWADLRSAALVGVGRRRVPDAARPVDFGTRPDGDLGDDIAASAVTLLDAAAVLAAGRRAGGRAGDAAAAGIAAPVPGPDDDTAEARATAVQLLELLLGPAPPAGAHRAELVAHWVASATAAARRVPPRLLVAVLDHATANPGLRRSMPPVLGARGRWLAERNPDWAWVGVETSVGAATNPAGAVSVDPDEWARLPAVARVDVLRTVRAGDPAAGRSLLQTTWTSDAAAARAAHLAVLADGLGPDDEDVLEGALDDRAATVRQQAATLLDGLPGSARARRMAERLGPLVGVEGRRRKQTIAVALPDDPDPSAVRDGLIKPSANRSARGWWLEQLAAGAPLAIWTDRTGEDPAGTLALLHDADARAGIVRAILARQDAAWATAAFRMTPDPRLLAAVDAPTRLELVTEQLRSKQRPNTVKLVALIGHVPAPWSLPFSVLVLDSIRADGAPVAALVNAGSALATGLHPDAQAHIERWSNSLEEQPQLAAALRTLISFQSIHRSITEAFA